MIFIFRKYLKCLGLHVSLFSFPLELVWDGGGEGRVQKVLETRSSGMLGKCHVSELHTLLHSSSVGFLHAELQVYVTMLSRSQVLPTVLTV